MMSPIATRVAARLATARQAGDCSALLTPEAAADTFALLCEAAPAPDQQVDTAALGDVCWMFFLRGQATAQHDGPDLTTALVVGGFLFERAPQFLPEALHDLVASVSDPLREARFAYAAAAAHGAAAMPDEDGIGVIATGVAALDRALGWSEAACQATTDRDNAAEAAEAMVQRMGLRSARFQLAADLDALEEAARDGLAIMKRLSPENPDHAAYLAPAAEVVVMSALMLGRPSADEAARFAGMLPSSTATESTAQMLSLLRAFHTEPVTWPGEVDARAGIALTAEASRTGYPGLFAAAVHRLRRALTGTPREHQHYLGLTTALGAALVDLGQRQGEADTVQEGIALLQQGGRLFRLLADQLSGSDVSAEIAVAAAILDLMAGSSADESSDRHALTMEWRAEFADALGRLPEPHQYRPVYATLLMAVTDDPSSAAIAATTAATKIDWTRLAAELRAAGPVDEVALALADGFEAVAGNMGELSAAALLGSINFAGADDGHGLLDLLTAKQDPAALQQAVQGMARSGQEVGDPELASSVPGGLGLAVALSLLAEPDRVAGWSQTWDQETRLAIASLLAARPQHTGDGPPELDEALATLGEMIMAGAAFSTESEVSQLDKFQDLGRRIVDMVGQLNPAIGTDLKILVDTVMSGLTGMAQTLEAIPQNQAAQSHARTIAEVRQRIADLAPEHPSRAALQPYLAILLSGQAFYLRDADPVQGRQLLAEATALADLENAREPISTVLRQHLGHTAAALEGPERPPIPGLRPGTSVEEVNGRLRQAGSTPEAIREMLADQELPVWLRVNVGFTTAFRITADLRVEEGLDCAERTVDLLAAITDRGADSASAEHAIASLIGGLPATYVSALLGMLHALQDRRTQTGPLVDRAAALAERSRGLLLARQLEGRTDLGRLRSAHPELASRFEALTTQLAADPDALAALRAGDNPPAAGRTEWARLAKFRASRELDALIARIRTEDNDFRDFMLPLRTGQLRELAIDGPVVMLNFPAMSHPRADAVVTPFALVVTSKAITSVRLEVQPQAVAEVAHRWTKAIATVNSRGIGRPGLAELRRAAADMTEILSWTWHQVVGPVLAAAGLPARSVGEDDADWPRIWWIPDGPFHSLPLHAAQCPASDCELGGPDRVGCGAALETVVSSYVPGLRILGHARGRAAGPSAGPALIVAATDDELPGAEAAAQLAAERLHAGAPLTGGAATRDAVTEALMDASVVHFGCHAASDPAEPSGGMLHLPSGEQLTVREICQAHPRAARLAFLTACSTARTSQRLASEAIHLSSAFLVAGFSEAVGTLWEIDSRDAYRVTTEFYQRITGERPQDGAVALHHCVRALRRERPGDPHIWSAYVHAGTEAREKPVLGGWSCVECGCRSGRTPSCIGLVTS